MQVYYEHILSTGLLQVQEATAKHAGKVLRMQPGEHIVLTDGRGRYCTALISDIGKTACTVHIANIETAQQTTPEITLAIAFTKNIDRIEWLLEKIVEIGIHSVYPILCERSVHMQFKRDRLEKIMLAAMCQSKQYTAPLLHEPLALGSLPYKNFDARFIAHCEQNLTRVDLAHQKLNAKSILMLIGPEGDFNQKEIDLCLQNNCMAVSIGETRLRTETAGLVAVTLLKHLVQIP
jgi:16S rRNA (uracil1498-N3)-methyltransferase